MLGALFGWGGVVAGTLTVVAQGLRVRRRGADGVSATTWSLFLFMSGFWLAYGVATSSTEITVSSIVGLPVLAALLALIEPGARRRGICRGAAAVAALALLPAALLGWDAGLLGIGVLVVATRAPQLARLVTARHAHGVSVASWLLGSAGVALWLGYDLATGRTVAALTMAAALALNSAIVALTIARHRGAALGIRAPRVAPSAAALEPALG